MIRPGNRVIEVGAVHVVEFEGGEDIDHRERDRNSRIQRVGRADNLAAGTVNDSNVFD